jgi:hypothetical protein
MRVAVEEDAEARGVARARSFPKLPITHRAHDHFMSAAP